jgi:hypothetical protein
VLVLLAAFSRHEEALAWGRRRAEATFGPIALESPPFPFDQTPYYDATMGPGLRKVFFAFARLAEPGSLADWKLSANAWEKEYALAAGHAEERPLNLDPGYLTLGKLVLASTKDFAHRVYLGRGVYAEITLFYRHRRWQHHAWTFPDYRSDAYHAFFSQCRDYLHQRSRGKEHVT